MSFLRYFCTFCCAVFLILLLPGCNKRDNTVSIPDTSGVVSTFNGRVLDTDGKPVSNATVHLAGKYEKTTLTNVDGEFTLQDVSIASNSSTVIVEKEGFFAGGSTLTPAEGLPGYCRLTLIPHTVAGNIQSASGGAVSLANGGGISFDVNSFVNAETGSIYNGQVTVLAVNSSGNGNTRPGGMSGIGVDNKLKFLRSYGMIAVELRGAQGEKLALAKGKVAEFKLPNLSGESTPSEEIPLWHFDIVEGVWKEKGKAILDGSNYKAYVSHFSFWSIDAPADAVELSMHFQDVSQTPAAFQRVRISEVSNDSSYVIVYTDSLGGIKTWVPKDKELMVKMFNSCPMLIYEGRIAPLTGNKDLGIVSTTEVVNVTAKVQGSISDCNGMPLKNGYAEIIINGNTRRAALDADGRFSLTVDVCQSGSASAYITGVDLDKKQQSLESQLIQISGGNTYTATPMVACGTSSEEYLRFTVNGIVTEFKAPEDRFFALWGVSVSGSNDTLTVIEAYNSNFSKHLMFAFLGKPVANIVHPNFDFDLDIEPNHFVGAAYREFDVSVTEYGSIGQYIAGHFSTNMYDKLYEKMVPVIGEFRIKRISYNGRTSRPIQGNK